MFIHQIVTDTYYSSGTFLLTSLDIIVKKEKVLAPMVGWGKGIEK